MTGLAMVSELTLVDRALHRLRGGPAAAAELCAEVLGLMGAPRAVAERVAIAVLGADPAGAAAARWPVGDPGGSTGFTAHRGVRLRGDRPRDDGDARAGR